MYLATTPARMCSRLALTEAERCRFRLSDWKAFIETTDPLGSFNRTKPFRHWLGVDAQ
jgi:hypothetical protein